LLFDRSKLRELRSNRVAQKQFYYYVYENLFHIPKRYNKTNQIAEEIFNDAMIKIFASFEKVEEIDNVLGWCSKIIFRTTIDKLRKELTYSERFEFPEDLPVTEGSISGILDKMDVEDLFSVIQKLPQKQQVIFSLFEIDGHSHKEIAETLGISETNSKYILSKAKQELRIMLVKSGVKY